MIKKDNICMLPILLQLSPLPLPDQSIYSIEGKFELNQKMLFACKLSQWCISRIDLGIKLELSESA